MFLGIRLIYVTSIFIDYMMCKFGSYLEIFKIFKFEFFINDQ